MNELAYRPARGRQGRLAGAFGRAAKLFPDGRVVYRRAPVVSRRHGAPIATPTDSAIVQALRSYWTLSRAARYSITFALPLLILYEALAASSRALPASKCVTGQTSSFARFFIAVAGARGPLLFVLCVIAVSIWLIARDLRRDGKLEPRVFVWMTAESIVLALVFGLVIGTLTARLLTPFAPFAIGASEEHGHWRAADVVVRRRAVRGVAVSRAARLGACCFSPTRARAGPTLANTFAVGLGALIFSAFHYIGAVRRSVSPRLVRVPHDRRRRVQRAVRVPRVRHHGVDPRAIRRPRSGVLRRRHQASFGTLRILRFAQDDHKCSGPGSRFPVPARPPVTSPRPSDWRLPSLAPGFERQLDPVPALGHRREVDR